MKVCIVSNLYSPNIVGGAERMAQALAEGLKTIGLNVFVITLSYTGKPEIRYINGIKVYYVKIRNIYNPYIKDRHKIQKIFWHFLDSYNPLSKIQFKSILEDEMPDLIHSHNLAGFSVSIWDTSSKLNIPRVHTLHDYYLLCYKSNMFFRNRNCEEQCNDCKIFSIFKREKSKYVEDVIGISSYILKKHQDLSYFANSNKIVLYNGIVNAIDSLDKGIRSNTKIFGFIGRLSPEKGIEPALDAFTQSRSPYTFLIAGEGNKEYESYLKARYKDKRIKFLGYVPNTEFFKQISVLVVPSIWNEPLGNVILEAFQEGIPVIGHDRGGIGEIIKDGYNGYLFESFNALKEIFSSEIDQYSFLSRNALKDFDKYLMDKYIDSHVILYKNIMDRKL